MPLCKRQDSEVRTQVSDKTRSRRHSWRLPALIQVVSASPVRTFELVDVVGGSAHWHNTHFIIVPCHTTIETSF